MGMSRKQQHSGDMGRWALGRDVIRPGHGQGSTIYMRRWFFWCPWFGVRVHHILRSDDARDFHDHPWDFASLLLTGGYMEVTPDWGWAPPHNHQTKRRWSFVRHKAEDLHRLVLDKPVWTLVFTGPKRKSWGFLTAEGMVPWREYLARKEPA